MIYPRLFYAKATLYEAETEPWLIWRPEVCPWYHLRHQGHVSRRWAEIQWYQGKISNTGHVQSGGTVCLMFNHCLLKAQVFIVSLTEMLVLYILCKGWRRRTGAGYQYWQGVEWPVYRIQTSGSKFDRCQEIIYSGKTTNTFSLLKQKMKSIVFIYLHLQLSSYSPSNKHIDYKGEDWRV